MKDFIKCHDSIHKDIIKRTEERILKELERVRNKHKTSESLVIGRLIYEDMKSYLTNIELKR